jgi:RHS repeat-associated protein
MVEHGGNRTVIHAAKELCIGRRTHALSKLTPLASQQPGSPYRQWPCGPLPTPNWRRAGLSLAIRLISAALLATQTWQIVETSGGLRFAKAAAQAQTPAPTPTAAAATPATKAAPATVGYDAVYGGVSQTTTADDTALTLTRDADGYSPVAIAYSGTSAGMLTFQYAPGDGRTVESDGAATTHLVYAGDYLPMAEFDAGAAPATRYHFPGQGQLTNYSQGGSGQLAVSADGSELFAVTDRLGSTRALLSAGAVQARFDYDMLGKPTETDNCSSACPAREYAYRYQSHRYILLASAGDQAGYQPGLQDFKARFYDHGQGRFLNTDLAGASISPYTAMGNDWVNNIDEDGLMPRRSAKKARPDPRRTPGVKRNFAAAFGYEQQFGRNVEPRTGDLVDALERLPRSWRRLSAGPVLPLRSRARGNEP